MKRTFTKMQGIGNDYIYFDCLEAPLENPEEVSRKLSDRHFGIGGDGIILILPSDKADFQMRMFNADGSESEMCGNGIRCFARYVYDKGHTDKTTMQVETGAGILEIDLILEGTQVSKVRVDMGEPILTGKEIPTTIDKEQVVNEPIEVGGESFEFTGVSMGNPHAIVYVDEITDHHVLELGPQFERHDMFPNRVNTEFIKVISPTEVQMRVWERGSGETLACGTGASAVGVAGVLTGKTERKILIHLVGGDLEIEWAQNNHVYMTGPAEYAFEGEVEL